MNRTEYNKMYNKKYREAHPDYFKARAEKTKDELREEAYNKQFTGQLGKCACCLKHQSKLTTSLVPVRNRKTNKIKLLVCVDCLANTYLDSKYSS